MPIVKPSNTTAPVFYPAENYTLAKYLDITKFLSLIQTNSLFFCRMDKFEDKYEGSLPEKNKEHYKLWTASLLENLMPDQKVTIQELEMKLLSYLEMSEKFKALNCISCWNKMQNESYALWKIYSNMNQGIMIKSNVERLTNAFSKTKEDIQISEVKYIDHRVDIIEPGNMNFPIIHKNKAYHYEEEIRLIHQVKFKHGLKYDWNKEPNPNGKNFKIDISELIDEVIISPFAEKWFYDIVADIMKVYKIDKKLKMSEFS
jgi:hypothetical protein